jgi:KDO2-lipid IV(A) lauroyltransferase
MLAKIGYYIFIVPLSYLPMRVIYLFSDILFTLLITVIPYRQKVIIANLKNSFPEKTDQELHQIKRKFYRHFCDLLAEAIKNLSISKRELSKRFTVKNPEIMDALFQQGKSVILVSGHYNNWEWMITSQNFLFPHQAMGIGMPLSSKFWDAKINERRQRFGMKVVNAATLKKSLENQKHEPIALLTLADQSPGDSKKSYWMNFLNQQTAVLFGTELLAHQHDFAVVFFITRKQKRGFYETTLSLITENPSTMEWGTITEKHVQLLEKEIIQSPHYWIWSHKRWKRKIPENLNKLKAQQRQQFDERFGIK